MRERGTEFKKKGGGECGQAPGLIIVLGVPWCGKCVSVRTA